ncbi:MAG: hypothetical protein ACFE9Z_14960 [Promethearchaeota archaeon]
MYCFIVVGLRFGEGEAQKPVKDNNFRLQKNERIETVIELQKLLDASPNSQS